nr:hypothetical protein [Tanacetum cinerariifolium]
VKVTKASKDAQTRVVGFFLIKFNEGYFVVNGGGREKVDKVGGHMKGPDPKGRGARETELNAIIGKKLLLITRNEMTRGKRTKHFIPGVIERWCQAEELVDTKAAERYDESLDESLSEKGISPVKSAETDKERESRLKYHGCWADLVVTAARTDMKSADGLRSWAAAEIGDIDGRLMFGRLEYKVKVGLKDAMRMVGDEELLSKVLEVESSLNEDSFKRSMLRTVSNVGRGILKWMILSVGVGGGDGGLSSTAIVADFVIRVYEDGELRLKERGPAGIVQAAKLRKREDTRECGKLIEDVGEDDDFTRGPWVTAVEYANVEGGITTGCLGDVKTFCQNGKLLKFVAVIKSFMPNALGDLTVTLKDALDILKNVVKVFHKLTVLGDGTAVGGSGILEEDNIIIF